LSLKNRQRFALTEFGKRSIRIAGTSEHATPLNFCRQQRPCFVPCVEAFEFSAGRNRGLQSAFVVKRRTQASEPGDQGCRAKAIR
jgi:hypothetical protein